MERMKAAIVLFVVTCAIIDSNFAQVRSELSLSHTPHKIYALIMFERKVKAIFVLLIILKIFSV